MALQIGGRTVQIIALQVRFVDGPTHCCQPMRRKAWKRERERDGRGRETGRQKTDRKHLENFCSNLIVLQQQFNTLSNTDACGHLLAELHTG